MPRKPSPSTPMIVAPHVIVPTAVYSVESARQALGLRSSTIRREVREGRLRISKRAGSYRILGSWLLEWIQGGELARRPKVAVTNHNSTNGTER